MDQPIELESRGRSWRSLKDSSMSWDRLKAHAQTGTTIPKVELIRGMHSHIVTGSNNIAQFPTNKGIHIAMDANQAGDNSDSNPARSDCVDSQNHQKGHDLPQSAATIPRLVTAVNGNRPCAMSAGAEDQVVHASPKPVLDSLNTKTLSNGSMAPSRLSVGVQDEPEQIFRPKLPSLPDLDHSVLTGDDFVQQEPSSVPAQSGVASTVTEPAAAEPANCSDSTTNEQRYQSVSKADKVVVILGPSSKDLAYDFNKSGLLVGFPQKIQPSVALQARWNDEIEPRLWHDVEAFKRTTKPVVKRGRVMFPGLSVELRMSGHASVGGSQVTLEPTVWFLYDDKKWERYTRRFVADLEWLSAEGFGAPEVQKGGPRLSMLEIPADHLQLFASEYSGISLPGGGELYVHAEEPQYNTACGILCCATFTQNGVVSTQYVSRIGGLLNLDARTAAITTAHGLVQEIFSEFNLYDIDNTIDSEEDEPRSDDDEEPPEQHSWEHRIGRIDSGVLETVSWLQIPPTSIQETCFFNTSGSNIQEILQRIQAQLEEEKSVALERLPCVTTLSADDRDSQAGDFSFLGLDCRKALCNSYQSEGEKDATKDTVVYRIAEAGEVDGGRVDLLLRPEKASKAVLLPGTILFGTNGVTLHARKISLDTPLGWLFLAILVKLCYSQGLR